MQELFSSPIQEINERHAKMDRLAKDALENAIRIGELLTNEKDKCKHGEWLPWIKANVQFSDRTANTYMRLFANKDKFEGASNIAQAYRLTIPKVSSDVSLSNEAKKNGKDGYAGPRNPAVMQQARVIIRERLASGASLNVHKLEEEYDIPHHAFELATAAELAREQALTDEAPIASQSLSKSDQVKLQKAIEQEKARLAAQFHIEVNARVKQFLADTIGPQLQKEQKDARWIMQSRKGVMTRKEFNQIRACLHTDRTATDEEKNKAFALFSSYEKFLLKEKESPTRFANIPSTPQEWDALRKAVSEARKRKSKEASMRKK